MFRRGLAVQVVSVTQLVVNQYKSGESVLLCFYNMFLPLLSHHQVETHVYYSQTTLVNVYMLHLLLFCRLYSYAELKLKIKIELD
jgi:hypothetical protein